jgi:hypothetical protein
MLKDQSKESRDSPINELAASIASKLARNTPAPSDPLQGEASLLAEDSFTLESERLDEVPAPKQVASQMSHDPLPGAKPTSGEYRMRADACLNWAREATTDEVRLACLTLANAWLKAAIGEDGGLSDHLPLAPRL